ncbi:unnamed protein product [Protopolystoma xenopodis]|uniref:Uncharacterized protein n=1 Tax=Protopolystoma xenopodis TaxID=117903 RepID=A0A448XGL8_9PLAT|nr:unnamed protein product [Protopolystoma xenopodis]
MLTSWLDSKATLPDGIAATPGPSGSRMYQSQERDLLHPFSLLIRLDQLLACRPLGASAAEMVKDETKQPKLPAPLWTSISMAVLLSLDYCLRRHCKGQTQPQNIETTVEALTNRSHQTDNSENSESGPPELDLRPEHILLAVSPANCLVIFRRSSVHYMNLDYLASKKNERQPRLPLQLGSARKIAQIAHTGIAYRLPDAYAVGTGSSVLER